MMTHRPTTLIDLSEVVQRAEKLRIFGSDSGRSYRLPTQPTDEVRLDGLSGIVDFWPADQVVSVRAGTTLQDLQAELDSQSQCLPLVEWRDRFSHRNGLAGTVGGAISLNLPDYLEAECGSWRDWVLGMTLVLADGAVVKVGSRAVKNVAGYDLQKLIIGSRGTLAVIAEVTLRTLPVRSLPSPSFQGKDPKRGGGSHGLWIQRTLATDFERARSAVAHLDGFDMPSSSTLWRNVRAEDELPRYDGDWVLRSGAGEKNLQITDPTLIQYMRRTKDLFDPTHKLNPGEMGIF